MKEAIKSIIIDELKKHGVCIDTGVLSAISSTIAIRLDKAIGIDEEKINSELLARGEWFYKFQKGNASCGWLRHKISKAIKELRPLKVTVDNE
jgi:hypothetical protein